MSPLASANPCVQCCCVRNMDHIHFIQNFDNREDGTIQISSVGSLLMDLRTNFSETGINQNWICFGLNRSKSEKLD